MTEKDKNIHAVALSKLGTSKGGFARAKKLSAKRRREIAQIASRSRKVYKTSRKPKTNKNKNTNTKGS